MEESSPISKTTAECAGCGFHAGGSGTIPVASNRVVASKKENTDGFGQWNGLSSDTQKTTLEGLTAEANRFETPSFCP